MKRHRYLLFAVFIAGLIILLELAARWCIFYASLPWPRFAESACWRYYWIAQYKDRAKERIKDLNSEVYIYANYDRTKGWNIKPNLRKFIGFHRELINTNSNGFRGIKEFTQQKTVGKKRIVLIGDSYTFGEENNDDKIFSYYLSKMLPRVDILNLGVRGYGHDQMLLKLQEEGVKYDPDIVILLFLGFDSLRNMETFRDYAKSKYVLKNGVLELTGVPVPAPQEVVKADRYHVYLIDCAKVLLSIFRNSTGLQAKEEKELTAAILREMKSTCDRSGAKFVIVAFSGDKDFLKSFVGDDIQCLYFNPDEKHKDRPVNAFLGHWKPEGHKIVAQCIYELIEKNKLLQN